MRTLSILFAAGLVVAAAPAFANDFASELKALAESRIKAIATSPEVIAAVKAQNATTGGYDQARIDELDKTWRAETEAVDQPMIDSVLNSPVSAVLTAARESSEGLFTEVFVMDAKGLNVAQSDPTSDYWQGDEDKWLETYAKGVGMVHVGDLEQDESTQTLQSQVSMTITDPDSNAAIGAITVGVNVDLLP
jgi:hypothetical protein